MSLVFDMIFKIICLFLLLGYTPYMAGNLVTRRYDRYQRRADIAYIIGFMVMMTLFELAAVPVIFKVRYGSFRMLFIIYSVMIIAVDVMGTFIWLKDRGLAGSGKNICSVRRGSTAESSIHAARETTIDGIHAARETTNDGIHVGRKTIKEGLNAGKIRKRSIGTRIMWFIVGALFVYMLVMAISCSWFDGDDAYYVAQSVITQQTGTMYSIQPYRGGSTGLDLRHVMAAFTMWISYVSTASGFHAAIFCHTVLPLVVIPITELIYIEIGRKLLGDKYRDLLPEFILFVMLFQVFGSTSIYTSETFLLTRTWQGKSMVANFLFPLMLWIWMEILGIGCGTDEDNSDSSEYAPKIDDDACDECKEDGNATVTAKVKAAREPWLVMLFLLSACAGVFSSLAVILISAFSGLIALLFAIRRRSMKLLINTFITLIPAIMYAVIYVLI
ncbi:MAG: hypothetical protein KBH85_08355 [Lachnospiraceae bacterium]|nr:hypothetical protein [Lachnospiraceae bacterium]